MTIETATPSSAETIAALFDNLVDAVAARVISKLDASIATHVEHAMDTWAMTSGTLEDKITEGVQAFVDNQLDLDDAVRDALNNLDLDDMVMTAVQELEFNVRVSR
jgi:glutamine synthetase type III